MGPTLTDIGMEIDADTDDCIKTQILLHHYGSFYWKYVLMKCAYFRNTGGYEIQDVVFYARACISRWNRSALLNATRRYHEVADQLRLARHHLRDMGDSWAYQIHNMKFRATKLLRQVLWRQVKGVMGMRVVMWRDSLETHKRRLRKGAIRWCHRNKARAMRTWMDARSSLQRQQKIGKMAIRKWQWRRLLYSISTWRFYTAEMNRLNRMASRAMRQWSKQLLGKSYSTWRAWYGDVKGQIRQLNSAVQSIRHRSVHRSYRSWQSYAKGSKRYHTEMSHAFGQLRHLLWRLVKGEMGMRLDIWRITMKDDERTAQLMQMMITRWVDMKTTKCFMSWLSLVRRRINEIAVVKRAVKSWMQPQVLHVFTTLRSVAADVKRVRQICMRSVKRWTRRSLAAAFDFWRVRCEEDIIQKRMLKNSIQKMMKQTLNRAYKSMKQHASAIRRRRKWKEEQMLQWSANSAQMLRRVVWKLVKGEIGMRLYLWRENITKLRLNDHNKLQAALSHVNGNHGAARLRLIFWRQVKGVVATSVDIWRACMNAEYTALRRAATRWHQRFTSKTLFEWLSQTRLMRQEKHALRTAILRWTQRRLWQVFSTFRNIAAMLKRTAAVATKATQRWRNQKLTSALRYWITSYQTFFTQNH